MNGGQVTILAGSYLRSGDFPLRIWSNGSGWMPLLGKFVLHCLFRMKQSYLQLIDRETTHGSTIESPISWIGPSGEAIFDLCLNSHANYSGNHFLCLAGIGNIFLSCPKQGVADSRLCPSERLSHAPSLMEEPVIFPSHVVLITRRVKAWSYISTDCSNAEKWNPFDIRQRTRKKVPYYASQVLLNDRVLIGMSISITASY